MISFDFTEQGRRPTAAQIVRAWKDAECPETFEVFYGETQADFMLWQEGWTASGNGCRGVDRNAVVRALTAATAKDRAS